VFFDGNTVNTLGAGFSQVVFHLTVTASLLVIGVFVACTIGMLGGLLPAIRAARQPIATALRAN
jgi:putative ABC transport system permease protein